jgi:NADP-dependent 3-hydroxy acid dehydrogenase YdfG
MSSELVVIVTGAGAGIGAAIVGKLLECNAKVVLVDIAKEPLEKFQEKHGVSRVQYVVGDVSKHDTNVQAVKMAVDTWGKIDAVALNAGIMAPVKRLCEAAPEDWTRIFNINVVSQVSFVSLPYSCCKTPFHVLERAR